mmetsp:Transcript_17473/g.31542  ORF Transcript_17473/g.31542 Transcript_17473/m.31542 type:complete len:267 (-) Transcript_17473:3-803(-)
MKKRRAASDEGEVQTKAKHKKAAPSQTLDTGEASVARPRKKIGKSSKRQKAEDAEGSEDFSGELATLLKGLAAKAEDAGLEDGLFANEQLGGIGLHTTEEPAIILEPSDVEDGEERQRKRAKNARKKAAHAKVAQAMVPDSSAPSAASSVPKRARAKREAEEKCQAVNPKREKGVFVRDLPWSVDEETLRADFSKFGEIAKMQYRRDRKGRPEGAAYVEYADASTAMKVLTLNGIEYKGRKIKVTRREPRKRSGRRVRARDWAGQG